MRPILLGKSKPGKCRSEISIRLAFPWWKKIYLFFISFLITQVSLFAQKAIEVKYEQNARGGYVFSCFNNAFCNYILEVGFTSFTNLTCDQSLPFHKEVKPGYTKLFTISAIDPQQPVQFKFGTANQKGCIQPDIKRDFIYLLPISPGKSAQVYEMSPDKQADSAGWYVLRLKMKPGDTIYASRKGIVNEVQDQSGVNDAGQSAIGNENFIEIAQPDCSFAHYGILKKNSSMVKPGQAVSAGQPIGLVGGDNFGRGSDLKFSIYYYEEENSSASVTRVLHYIIPQIWTKTNGKGRLKHGAVYVSEFPTSVLNSENPKKVSGAKRKA